LDLALDPLLFDSGEHATSVIDCIEKLPGGGFEFVGEMFEIVTPPERIDGIGDP
jgi:hypothetical protein